MPKFSSIVPCIFLTLLIIFITRPCNADFLDYRDIIIDSIGYSAALRVKKEDVLISEAQYKSTFAGLYPQINIGGYTERFENLDDRDNTDISTIGSEVIGGESAWKSSVSLSGQYYISHWYKKRFEASYYEYLRNSSIHECEAEEKKMIREVTDIFRVIMEGKIKLKYANEILARLNEILKLKKAAAAMGQFSYEDVLKAQTDVINTQKDIALINKDIREYFENLKNYTGKSYPNDIEVIPLRSNNKLSIVDETSVIPQTPEYKARHKELEAFRFKEKSAGNNFLPDISVYGRYDLYNSSPNNMSEALSDVRPIDYSVGLYISLPLFDGGARRWEREKTLHELKKSEENARLVYNEKNKEIKTLQAGYEEISKSYSHYKKLHDQYKILLEINKKSQVLGERSNLDIFELENDALTVERDLKIVEHTMAVYEKQLSLEINFNEFIGDYGGNGTCQH